MPFLGQGPYTDTATCFPEFSCVNSLLPLAFIQATQRGILRSVPHSSPVPRNNVELSLHGMKNMDVHVVKAL